MVVTAQLVVMAVGSLLTIMDRFKRVAKAHMAFWRKALVAVAAMRASAAGSSVLEVTALAAVTEVSFR